MFSVFLNAKCPSSQNPVGSMGSDNSEARKGDGFAVSAFRRRERIYQCVILVFVVWNLSLQFQAPSTSGVDAHSLADDVPHATFVSPDTYTDGPAVADAKGRREAGTVCSGCSDQYGLTPADKVNVATGSNATTNVTAPITSNTSASLAGAGNASTAAATAESMPTNNTTSAAKPSVPTIASAIAAGAPPPPLATVSTVLGLAEGAACSSTFKGDSSEAKCFEFCQAKFARFHCERCKCRSCAFCPRTTPPSASLEATTPAATTSTVASTSPNATATSIVASSSTAAAEPAPIGATEGVASTISTPDAVPVVAAAATTLSLPPVAEAATESAAAAAALDAAPVANASVPATPTTTPAVEPTGQPQAEAPAQAAELPGVVDPLGSTGGASAGEPDEPVDEPDLNADSAIEVS